MTDAPNTRRLSALAPASLAEVLSLASRASVTEEMIRRDLAAGAPVNDDGTVNLLHYCAWLLQEQRRDGRSGAPPPR